MQRRSHQSQLKVLRPQVPGLHRVDCLPLRVVLDVKVSLRDHVARLDVPVKALVVEDAADPLVQLRHAGVVDLKFMPRRGLPEIVLVLRVPLAELL